MNEVYEVFGGNYDDCAGLAHVIMSSTRETLLRNANDGVRTQFIRDVPYFYDHILPGKQP